MADEKGNPSTFPPNVPLLSRHQNQPLLSASAMQSSKRPSSRSSSRRHSQLCLLLSEIVVILIARIRIVSPFQPKSSHSDAHNHRRLSGKTSSLLHLSSSSVMEQSKDSNRWTRLEGDPHVETILFVECGFGNDSHGQNVTKAAGKNLFNIVIYAPEGCVRNLGLVGS